MLSQIGPAIRMTLLMTLLTGLLYPLGVTGLARALFPRQAGGSLILSGGAVAGSDLIGQAFTRPEYFHPRPSAAGSGYDGMASGGSNYGPTNAKLVERVKSEIAKIRLENPDYAGPIPADMVLASGSGLDPHISPLAAEVQIARVAKARKVTTERVRQLVQTATEGRTLGFIGEPRVNVLPLNLELDRQTKTP